MRSIKKEKDPCFLFYSQDWMTGTYGFTRAQKGSFIDLLTLQHQGVALNPTIIQKACEGNIDDVKQVLTKFVKDEDGNYYNEKLRKVMTERAAYKIKQSVNASKRGATAQRIPKPNLSTHVENEDVIEEPITIEHLDARTFQSLDDLYQS